MNIMLCYARTEACLILTLPIPFADLLHDRDFYPPNEFSLLLSRDGLLFPKKAWSHLLWNISVQHCLDSLKKNNPCINDNCTSNMFFIVLFLLIFQLRKLRDRCNSCCNCWKLSLFHFLKEPHSDRPSMRSPTVTARSESTEFKGILKGPMLRRGYLSPCVQTLCLYRTQVNCTLQITIRNST